MKYQRGIVWVPVIVAVVIVGGAVFAAIERDKLKNYFSNGDIPADNARTAGGLTGVVNSTGSGPDTVTRPVASSTTGLTVSDENRTFTGVVRTGASLGSVKEHCAEGLYLVLDQGQQINVRQNMLLLKDADKKMISDRQYVDKRVLVTGSYPDENTFRCEALICGCEEYLIAERIELAPAA